MSNEQEMQSNHFYKLSQALPEGINWFDPVTPQIADAIWQADTLAAEARIREVGLRIAQASSAEAIDRSGVAGCIDNEDLLQIVDAALTEHKENQG